MPPIAELFSLAGRTALVTGGSRGLGLAIARGLASAGAAVTVVARNAPPADAGLGFIAADLGDAESRRGLVDGFVKQAGKIDIFVHAAGQQHRSPSEIFPADRWNEIMELHVNAAMDLCQQSALHMLPRGRGNIILVSSIVGFQGGWTVPAYAAAKHALLGIVKALSNEWAGKGLHVNALAPGYFDVGVGTAVVHDPVRGPQVLARTPAGRVGRPEDIVGPAVFLASDASGFVHGQALVVDGGWLGR
ncbi:MAG: SDR family oxidoreductase [Planctomycetes bacterium]|nr:SDR family oxidoreductase [Planctomycetota bacterium]